MCETCWAVRSGDAEFRPVGNRTVWLDDFALSDEHWASFQIPIGLAFFMDRRSRAAWSGCTRARRARPSASSTSRRGQALVADNPVLETLEADAEALVVNRIAEPPQHAIVPIDVPTGSSAW